MASTSAERPDATLREELAICKRLLGAKIRGQLQYRMSFVLQVLGNLAIHGAELIAILALFNTFQQLGDWNAGEVAFLYAVTYVSFAIGHIAGNRLPAI